jgi:hypothetical protein
MQGACVFSAGLNRAPSRAPRRPPGRSRADLFAAPRHRAEHLALGATIPHFALHENAMSRGPTDIGGAVIGARPPRPEAAPALISLGMMVANLLGGAAVSLRHARVSVAGRPRQDANCGAGA